MKAMLLCAGKGTRLRPMTWDTPKPMVPLIDKPVLQYIIEHLKAHDVEEVALNLSYLPDRIHNYFRDGSNHGVGIFYSYEGEIQDGEFVGDAVGSAGGLKKIQDETAFFDDTFLVLCGDAVVNLDITKLVKQHKERGALATIVLKNVDQSEVDKYGIVALSEEGRIEQFQEKPTPSEAVSTTANTGIYIFEPELFDHIPAGVEYDLGGELFPALCELSDRFYGAVEEFDWVDIGNLKDYQTASSLMLTAPPEGVELAGREIAPGIRVGPNVSIDLENTEISGPVYIGGGSVIPSNAKIIGPSVIGQNCKIGENAVIHKCVLGDHTRVNANTLLTRAIVYGGYIVGEDGTSEELTDTSAVGDARTSSGASAVCDSSVANLNLVDRLAEAEFAPVLEKRARAS